MKRSAFLSCDWGTTTFRLRWMEGERVIRQFRNESGCRALFDLGGDRAGHFAAALRSAVQDWAAPAPMPLVISGMASSSIGWREVAYAALPLRLDASSVRYECLEWDAPPLIGRTFLISGAASADDMMRGEEAEAIGILQDLEIDSSSTLILPGTHSKHLTIEEGSITGLRTFMTGELFEVLTRHSILKATTAASARLDVSGFLAGVQLAKDAGLAASLFKARSRGVLGKRANSENASFLSGLLVGSELIDLKGSGPVIAGGGAALRAIYVSALKHLGFAVRELLDEQVENAVPRAHAQFLRAHAAWMS